MTVAWKSEAHRTHGELAKSLRDAADGLPTVSEAGLLPAHATMLKTAIGSAKTLLTNLAGTADIVSGVVTKLDDGEQQTATEADQIEPPKTQLV